MVRKYQETEIKLQLNLKSKVSRKQTGSEEKYGTWILGQALLMVGIQDQATVNHTKPGCRQVTRNTTVFRRLATML